jgi:hypothetical protein
MLYLQKKLLQILKLIVFIVNSINYYLVNILALHLDVKIKIVISVLKVNERLRPFYNLVRLFQ